MRLDGRWLRRMEQKNLSIQIAGYHPTIRTRNSCCNGGLRHFTLLGANHILHGLLRQTHSRTTRESFRPQLEK